MLKLRRLGWSPAKYLLVALAIIPPTAIGMTGAWGLTFLIPPDPTVQQIYDSMTLPFIVPYLLFISLVPGFGEEFFFRGFLQGRLLERLRPGPAILLSSVIFGLFHVMPHAILFATVVGLWLGYVAWKTDSIWPTIVSHAFVNGIWNVYQIGSNMLNFSDGAQYLILGLAILIGFAALIASLKILNGKILSGDISLSNADAGVRKT
jgi:membrane protease YdiL (CAAX protease family)